MKKGLLFSGLIIAMTLLCCYALVFAGAGDKKASVVTYPSLDSKAPATKAVDKAEVRVPGDAVDLSLTAARGPAVTKVNKIEAPKVQAPAEAAALVAPPADPRAEAISRLKEQGLYDEALWDAFYGPRKHREGYLDQGGEDCSVPTLISDPLPYDVLGTTAGYVNDYDPGVIFDCPYTGSTAPDVVYEYSPDADRIVDINLCWDETTYDTKLYVYEDNCGDLGSIIACNDDACPGYVSQILGLEIFTGHTYYIVVDGYGTDAGDYRIVVSEGVPPPPGPECPEGSLWAQEPDLPEAVWVAGTSDLGQGYCRADDFFDLTAPICDVHWWGLSLYYPWEECEEDPMTFEIKFYEAGAVPGAVVCTYTVDATRTATGLLYAGFEMFEWSAYFGDDCCYLADGWVSIQGTSVGTPLDCWLLWMSSGEQGGGNSVYSDMGGPWTADTYYQDLAFCLTGEGELLGACCDPYTGECTDDVNVSDCPDPLLFYANQLCANLDPACGMGACCNDETGECMVTSYADCQEPGFTWMPGLDCDPNPCPQPCGDYEISVDCTGFSATSTTCGAGDDCATRAGEDEIWEIHILEDALYTFSLCNSPDWDTYIYLDYECCGATHITYNDDSQNCDYSLLSEITCWPLMAGETVYLLVEPYSSGNCNDYQLDISCCVPCELTCPEGGIPEGEPTCEDEYDDMYNGGCNSDPFVFSPISCGDIICGEAGTFLFGGSQYRDTDWYEITFDQAQDVTFKVVAEFALQVLIINGGSGDCVDYSIVASATAGDCDTISLSWTCPAGLWWFWVGPSVFSGVPCGPMAEYVAELICEEPPPPQPGDLCDDPAVLTIPPIPLVDNNYTCGRTNYYDMTCLDYYDGGEDIIYELNVTEDVCVDIILDPLGTTYTGIAIDQVCPPGATCMAFHTQYEATQHGLYNMNLAAGTYYIMIDTWPSPNCIPEFDLYINECTQCVPDYNISVDCAGGTWTGNTCGAGDDCQTRPGEEEIWEIQILEDAEYRFSLCDTDPVWDTYIYLDYECCGASHIAYDDDGCGTLLSMIDCVYLTAGTYYLLIEPYSSSYCGEYELDITCCAPCFVECPPEGYLEGEPFCEDEYDDVYNGGCNSDPYVFQDVQCDDIICATSGTFYFAGGAYRDTDWFRLELAGPNTWDLTWCVVAEFDPLIFIIDAGSEDCIDYTILGSLTGFACDTTCLTFTVDPGVYWLWCGPQVFGTGVPCGTEGGEYVGYVICEQECVPQDYCQNPIITGPGVPVGTNWVYDNTENSCCGLDCVPEVYEYGDYPAGCSGSTYSSGPDIVYKIVTTAVGNMTITASGPGDNQVMMFTDPDDPTGSCEASADNTFTGEPEVIGVVGLPAGTYYISTSLYSTACGDITLHIESDVPLPVELTSLEAVAGDREVDLTWTTASETDNAEFMVQRSTATSDWTTVGTVASENNATETTYNYTDRGVVNGVTYTYRLLSRDINGTVHEYDMTADATPEAPLPTEYALEQNYPNPFNPNTSISYAVKEGGFVSLKVYNLLGQEVATLVSQRMEIGRYTATFSANDLPSGIYVYRLVVNDFTAQKKMVLLK